MPISAWDFFCPKNLACAYNPSLSKDIVYNKMNFIGMIIYLIL